MKTGNAQYAQLKYAKESRIVSAMPSAQDFFVVKYDERNSTLSVKANF